MRHDRDCGHGGPVHHGSIDFRSVPGKPNRQTAFDPVERNSSSLEPPQRRFADPAERSFLVFLSGALALAQHRDRVLDDSAQPGRVARTRGEQHQSPQA